MSDTKILITDAGLAEVINAEQSGTAPVVLSHIAFGTGQYTPTANMTALESEFKRFESVKGGAVGDNVIHLTIHDSSTDTYTVNEVGVFTDSGTLFAVYSQTTPIIQKASESETMLAIDIVLEDIDAASITVGDTDFILNPATTTKQGVVELATNAEAIAGTDTSRAVTPAALNAKVDNYDTGVVHKAGTETISGAKTFTYGSIVLKSNSIDPSTAPSADKYANYAIYDKDGNWLGVIGAQQNASDNGTSMRFQVIRKINGETKWGASLQCIMTEDGTTYTYAPHPDSSNNTASNKIATVGFVSDPSKSINIVHRTGDETIAGTKTFSSSPKVPTASNTSNNTTAASTAFVQTALSTAKAYTDTEKAKYLPLAGGKMTGSIYQNNDTRRFIVGGGSTYNSGAHITLDGKSYTDGTHSNGSFTLVAHDGTNNGTLIGQPDGSLTWEEKNIVRSINNTTADASGNVAITSVASATSATSATKATQDGNGNVIADTYATKSYVNTEKAKYLPLAGGKMTTTKSMSRDVNNSFLGLHGGTGENNDGAQLYLCGSNHPTTPSRFQLHARNADTDVILQGGIDGSLEWDGKHVLNNSFLMPTDGGAINLTAGTSSAGGAYFRLYGKEHEAGAGQFVLATTDGESTNALVGKPDGTLTWNGKPIATGATSTITYWE